MSRGDLIPSGASGLEGCPTHGAHRVDGCEGCHVRTIAICAALNPEEFDRLHRIVSSRTIEDRRELIVEGEPGVYAYSIQSGCLKLFKSLPDGRRQIMGFLLPGDFVGLPPRGRYGYSAEAIGHAAVCRFPKREFEDLMRTAPDLEHRFLSIIRDELVAAQEHMLLLGRRTARERLACFLLDFRRRFEAHGTPVDPLELPMTRVDIADYLGLTVETVSRTFSQLRRSGLLELPKSGSVRIRDLDGLARLCEGE